MPVYQRKETGAWFVKYRDEYGKQRSKTFGKGGDAKIEAEVFDLEVKRNKLLGEIIPESNIGDMYLSELCQFYIEDRKVANVSLSWLRDWSNILSLHILPELDSIPVSQMNQQYVLRFFLKRYSDVDPTTRNRYIRYLKTIFNFGVNQEYIEKNPLAKWRSSKEKPRQSMLTVKQLAEIKKHAVPHVAWSIEVAYNLGVRTGPSELLALRWDWIDWENKQFRIYATKTKKWRQVPISDLFVEKLQKKQREATTEFLVEYNGRGITSIKKGFKNACRRAGLGDSIISYDIRHLFATTLLNSGGDLASVSNLMGHSSTRMTADQYYHLQKGEKIRTIGLLPEL